MVELDGVDGAQRPPSAHQWARRRGPNPSGALFQTTGKIVLPSPAAAQCLLRILVKADAVMFLLGSVIDHETTRLASKFVFRNPNQTDACGCGESVTIVPANLEA